MRSTRWRANGSPARRGFKRTCEKGPIVGHFCNSLVLQVSCVSVAAHRSRWPRSLAAHVFRARRVADGSRRALAPPLQRLQLAIGTIVRGRVQNQGAERPCAMHANGPWRPFLWPRTSLLYTCQPAPTRTQHGAHVVVRLVTVSRSKPCTAAFSAPISSLINRALEPNPSR